MDLFVGVTDGDWYELLASQPGLDEVNHADNFIVGGGVFAHASLLPASLAWELFGIANGATTIVGGWVILTQPFFIPRDRWIPVPASWHPNIVQGKTYSHDEVEGRALWNAVQDALRGARADAIKLRPAEGVDTGAAVARFGEPTLVRPRLGQGSFRVVVTDAYERRCAVTKEPTQTSIDSSQLTEGHR